jgi:hypothetical protein
MVESREKADRRFDFDWLRVIGVLLVRANAAVLPFFMLHMPIVAIVMYSVSHWGLGLLPTFLVIIGLSLPVTLLLCDGVRRFRISSLLLGLKVKTV